MFCYINKMLICLFISILKHKKRLTIQYMGKISKSQQTPYLFRDTCLNFIDTWMVEHEGF